MDLLKVSFVTGYTADCRTTCYLVCHIDKLCRQMATVLLCTMVPSTFWCTWPVAPVEVACDFQSNRLADGAEKIHLMQPGWAAPPHQPERDMDSATLPSALDLDWTFGCLHGHDEVDPWCAFRPVMWAVCFLLTWTLWSRSSSLLVFD